ncbi:MAG: hypothetical protein GX605_01445 [Chloroflexi bacterium]|nr:hypothetical protein [Chloroflexota bacterium]
MDSKTELLFPYRLIAGLATLRGPEWQALVRRVAALPEEHDDVVAFMLLITQISRCATCEQGSFRAWQGCAVCSRQAVERFKGSDQELLHRFAQAQREVQQFLAEAA